MEGNKPKPAQFVCTFGFQKEKGDEQRENGSQFRESEDGRRIKEKREGTVNPKYGEYGGKEKGRKVMRKKGQRRDRVSELGNPRRGF